MTQYNNLNVKLSNFPHKLLLTNRQVANLCNVFTNNSSTDIK